MCARRGAARSLCSRLIASLGGFLLFFSPVVVCANDVLLLRNWHAATDPRHVLFAGFGRLSATAGTLRARKNC